MIVSSKRMLPLLFVKINLCLKQKNSNGQRVQIRHLDADNATFGFYACCCRISCLVKDGVNVIVSGSKLRSHPYLCNNL